MRLLRELHLYPGIGFNDIRFGDTEGMIRRSIGDPYVTIRSNMTPGYKCLFNDGNLILYFNSKRQLISIEYEINHSNITRLYIKNDAVSSHIDRIRDWFIDHDTSIEYTDQSIISKGTNTRVFSKYNRRKGYVLHIMELKPIPGGIKL